MTRSAQLWAANADVAEACLTHPFVQGIADGTLERDRFVAYVEQDAWFLTAFARAYAIALAKAPDVRTMDDLRALLNGVFEFASQFGIEGIFLLRPVKLEQRSAVGALMNQTLVHRKIPLQRASAKLTTCQIGPKQAWSLSLSQAFQRNGRNRGATSVSSRLISTFQIPTDGKPA